jgi:aquaporin Z
MRKYITEGIGTFFIMLTVAMATSDLAPWLTGAVLVAMVYAGAQVSGSHYNPAVSLAMVMRNRLAQAELPNYVLAQLAGAVLATLIGSYLMHSTGRPVETYHPTTDPIAFILAEFFGAFAWVYVLLQVNTTRHVNGHVYYGWAVGIIVVAMAGIFGSISGGVFNPAVALGKCIQTGVWIEMLYFLVGQLLGAAAAATVITLVHTEEA